MVCIQLMLWGKVAPENESEMKPFFYLIFYLALPFCKCVSLNDENKIKSDKI